MKILVVKLSSLGDVVHAMPAVQDIRLAIPDATIDWVVERGFAPLVQRCEGVRRVIPCQLRAWRKTPLSAVTRQAWFDFKDELQREPYDAVLDLQGLTKSALIARLAPLTAQGRRYALGNRTEGSSYEAPTRWVADVAIPVTPRSHAVARSRELCAKALGYAWDAERPAVYGLRATAVVPLQRTVALVHGTSRADKQWPEADWIALGRRLLQGGYQLALPQGSPGELACAQRIAQALDLGADSVWPAMGLDALVDRISGCAGVIGVDSGISHIAVALDLPHVQLYNFNTAWRTGPAGGRQVSVYADPRPTLDAVWQAWQGVEPG